MASIGEASTDESGATTIPVEVVVDGGTGLPTGSPVDVVVSIVAATDVLTVPVEAVLALAEGGYAVEVRDGTTTHLVGVELGTFADGFVEITGDVAEGAEVVARVTDSSEQTPQSSNSPASPRSTAEIPPSAPSTV